MGLKLAKQILANPETANHGETLAMKGLILNCMGKKDEAYEYVRKGLRNDLTSHVCWHVYGLVQRLEHKYDEAIKCYRNALKYDKDNITILRDLSMLQIQMRDLEGFRDTRYQLFMIRSAQRVSWISFAVAYHLLKDYSTAAKILDEFRRTQKQQKSEQTPKPHQDSDAKNKYAEPIDYEQSELFLYQVMILQEAGSYKEALEFLNKNSAQICDRLAVLEIKVELLLSLSRNLEAAKLLEDQLISRNQENYTYYRQLEQALNLSPDDEVSRLNFYKTTQQKYPRAKVPFKIPLGFVENPEAFKPLVDSYLRKAIQKHLPALFRNLKSVYDYDYDKMVSKLNQELMGKRPSLTSDATASDCGGVSIYIEQYGRNSVEAKKIRAKVFKTHGIPPKIKQIQDLMYEYDKNLTEKSSFDSDIATKDSADKTCVLWVYFYLAQHYDYLGQYDTALEYVRKAIDHTPTLIELLTLKGKIYKHLGEIDKAAEQVNEAQRLDTADRYLNSKCAKYFLRANKVSQAEELCSKYTRAGAPVSENLNEMQCAWFQKESAQAYYRMEKYGLALKKCYEIDSYFSEVTEDQFDFHTYCMRKMTLKSYIKLLRMEDVLRSHRFYFDVAEIAIKIYLKLHDDPAISMSDDNDNKTGQNKNEQLSAAELKKIRSKERKAAAKQQQNSKHQGNTKGGQAGDGDSGKSSKGSDNQTTSGGGNSSSGGKQSQANSSGDSKTVGNDSEYMERPKDPLEKAVRFLKPLLLLATERIDTHLLAYEVYKRREKYLLMLRSLKKAYNLNPYHLELRSQLSQFLKLVASLSNKAGPAKLPEPVSQVLQSELEKLK